MSDEPDDEIEVENDIQPSQQATVDAGDVQSLRRQKRKLSREQEESRVFWTKVFSDPIGRREMWGILQSAHTFEERFACGPVGFPDTNATWFHAGEQALGQRLFLSWQQICREGVWLMQEEHDSRFAEKPKKKNG